MNVKAIGVCKIFAIYLTLYVRTQTYYVALLRRLLGWWPNLSDYSNK